jgi:hypothetical protein
MSLPFVFAGAVSIPGLCLPSMPVRECYVSRAVHGMIETTRRLAQVNGGHPERRSVRKINLVALAKGIFSLALKIPEFRMTKKLRYASERIRYRGGITRPGRRKRWEVRSKLW